METRKWNPTGDRQGDGTLKTQNSSVTANSRRFRVMDRVRVFAGSVKWSYLELEDDLKCHFWKLFSGSRARCNSEDCPYCNPRATESPGMTPGRDGRFSSLLQKIRTWPRLGSRRIRDHMSQDAPQPGSGPARKPDRIKAASFPAKHRDLSRARFLPKFKKFESIREENDHGVSAPSENQLPRENETIFVNVVGCEIPGSDAEATPSVEDLDKYSYSFGSEMSFGNREDSMSKDLSMPRDLRSSTLGHYVPASTGTSEVSDDAEPAPQTIDKAWDFPSSPLGQSIPAPAVSSEVSESAGPVPGGFDNGSNFYAPQLIESPIPEACTTSQIAPKSRFNGVRWKAKKWTSEIRPPNSTKTVWLGTYATEEEAASAFDAGIFYYDKAKDYNFPDSEKLLPMLDRTKNEREQLHFIDRKSVV